MMAAFPLHFAEQNAKIKYRCTQKGTLALGALPSSVAFPTTFLGELPG